MATDIDTYNDRLVSLVGGAPLRFDESDKAHFFAAIRCAPAEFKALVAHAQTHERGFIAGALEDETLMRGMAALYRRIIDQKLPPTKRAS